MGKNESDTFSVIVIAIFAILITAMFVGNFVHYKFQQEAIENNAAEWRIDSKTGEKQFVWLTNEKDKTD